MTIKRFYMYKTQNEKYVNESLHDTSACIVAKSEEKAKSDKTI